MDLYEALRGRRSIRKYKPEEPDRAIVTKVLDAATWAPSDGNKQPWFFVVATGDHTAKLAAIFHGFAKEHIGKAPYIPAEQKAAMIEYSKDFGGAPVVVTVCYEQPEDHDAAQDALQGTTAAVQNLLLAAHAEGLGAVWISHILDYPETRELLRLKDGQRAAAVIALGYPDEAPAAPPRVSAEEKTTWL